MEERSPPKNEQTLSVLERFRQLKKEHELRQSLPDKTVKNTAVGMEFKASTNLCGN